MSAEKAEIEADRALASARIRVREAREEVKRLEVEAAEEARRAKIKQYHAREVSKRGKQLGRKLTSYPILYPNCVHMLTCHLQDTTSSHEKFGVLPSLMASVSLYQSIHVFIPDNGLIRVAFMLSR